jgi:hypothetical protein
MKKLKKLKDEFTRRDSKKKMKQGGSKKKKALTPIKWKKQDIRKVFLEEE